MSGIQKLHLEDAFDDTPQVNKITLINHYFK